MVWVHANLSGPPYLSLSWSLRQLVLTILRDLGWDEGPAILPTGGLCSALVALGLLGCCGEVSAGPE